MEQDYTEFHIGEDSHTDIDTLIEWLQEQKEKGYNSVHLYVQHGYYNSIEDIILDAENW